MPFKKKEEIIPTIPQETQGSTQQVPEIVENTQLMQISSELTTLRAMVYPSMMIIEKLNSIDLRFKEFIEAYCIANKIEVEK